MSNTEVLWFFMLDYSEGWGIRKHSHDDYQMYYVIEGQGEMSVYDTTISLVEGLCLIVHPGVTHELLEMETSHLRMAQIRFALHDENMKAQIQQAPTLQTVDTPAISLRLGEMKREWESSLPFKKDVCNLLMNQILYEYLRIQIKAQRTSQLFATEVPKPDMLSGLSQVVAEYAQRHCFESFSLDDMAQEMNYNKNYLCKIFKNSTGHTIIGYVNCLRVAKAIELVCYTNTKLSEIAEVSGFHDIHYFTKVFKKVTGHTPGDLRTRGKLDTYANTAVPTQITPRYFNKDWEKRSQLKK